MMTMKEHLLLTLGISLGLVCVWKRYKTKSRKQSQISVLIGTGGIGSLESVANASIAPYIAAYFGFRAGTVTKAATEHAYDRLRIVKRVMRDVSAATTAVEIFGCTVQSPIIIAPTAFHALLHPSAEIGTATGALEAGCIYTYNFMYSTTAAADIVDVQQRASSSSSSSSSSSLSASAASSSEPVASSSPLTRSPTTSCLQWAHTYMFKNRDLVLYSLKRSEQLGFSAVVVTCDHPHDRVRNSTMPAFAQGDQAFLKATMRFPNVEAFWKTRGIAYDHDVVGVNDPAATWSDIAWIKNNTTLPLICKGVLTVADALLAVEHGADGIIVSNHGNRQTDCTVPAVEILPDIVAAVRAWECSQASSTGSSKRRTEIFIDSGIRDGSHVFKAIALGATAVLVGRPPLWGLCLDGARGVSSVLTALTDDFRYHMQSAGCVRVQDINSDLLIA